MATVSLQAVYDQARRLLESGDADRASAVAQHILRSFPHDLEAHRLLGEAYLAGRQFEQAQSAFQTVLYSDPENIPAYVGLGVTHERLNQLDQAIQAFEHALEIKPDMAELRSQLLRLYTETWGSDNAQLRLSRVGLARLYAKGHMLPQAIQEFRSVTAEQHDRFDAHVALAEVLWRDGQEDAAVAACEEALAERPELLKPNLILGYTLLASGDPRGDQYWNAAFDLDPYQIMAHTLFDQLPNSTHPQPTIAEWDENEWQAQHEQHDVQQDQIASQPHEESVVATATQEDDFFGGSWMDTIGQPESQEVAATGDTSGEDDDFLSRLLAFEDLSADTDLNERVDESVHTAEDEPEMQPFSLADLGLSDDEITAFNSPSSAESASDTPEEATDQAQQYETRVFSLADLGLDDEQSTTSQPTETPAQDQPRDTQVFSLADLGLDDTSTVPDEVPMMPPPVQAEQADDEPDFTPFSLSDLGLTDDEIASLDTDATSAPAPSARVQPEQTGEKDADALHELGPDQTNTPSETPTSDDLSQLKPFSFDDWSFDQPETSDLQPFSLDDLDISNTDTSKLDIGELPSSLQPFSLDDIADTPASPTARSSASSGQPQAEEPRRQGSGFTFRQSSSEPTTDTGRNAEPAEQGGESSIFARLKQRRSEIPTEEPPPLQTVADDDMDMSLFSHGDDVSLRDDEMPQPEPSSVASQSEPASPVKAEEPDLTPFSLSDLGLSPEEIDSLGLENPAPGTSTTPAPIETQPVASATSAPAETQPAVSAETEEPDLTPFSLSDLGLSPEEIASLGLEEPAPIASATTPPAETQPPVPASPVEAEEPNLTPFSLSDLGLSPEEIASLGLEESAPDTSTTPAPIETQSTALEPSETQPATPTSSPVAEEEPDLTPFSLSDLGLSPEEIASLGLDTESTTTPPQSQTTSQDDFDFDMLDETPSSTGSASNQMLDEQIESDLQPFSLDDLGLSDDDLSPFASSGSGSELGLTDDELSTMDLGALESSSAQQNAPASSSDADTYEVDTGDPVLDRLITIGRRQGFVDLTDIINGVTNPEEESERIEEIGQVLHRAGIQIRDGDEIIDMDELDEIVELDELGEMDGGAGQQAQPTATPVASEDEPDMTPFSLSDLGLSPEEIASLGLDQEEAQSAAIPAPTAEAPEAQPTTPTSPPADEEPDMTPFSLSDLGLSPEEIASLGLDQEQAQSAAAPAPTAEASEANVEPVAQSAATPAAETPEAAAAPTASETPADTSSIASTETGADEEVDFTPFSLSDLGLSPEEIASLGLEDTNATTAEAAAETSTDEEVDFTPFSLSDLGLSPEEIASLDLPAADTTSLASDENDVFDFSAVDETPRPLIPSTPRVREEEPPPPEAPEDAAFVAEPLEELDSIWEELPAQEGHAAPLAPSAPPEQKAPAQATPEQTTTTQAPPEQSAPSQAPSERIARIERIERTPRSAPAEPQQPPAARTVARREPTPSSQPSQPSQPTPPASAQPVAPAPRAAGAARSERSETWRKRESSASAIPTGDATLDGYLQQLEAEPNNDGLRLAVARIGGQTGRLDLATQQYRILTRASRSLDQVEEDIQELIDDTEDPKSLQRLYRLLGDVYTKQNRFRDAVEAYSWTFGK